MGGAGGCWDFGGEERRWRRKMTLADLMMKVMKGVSFSLGSHRTDAKGSIIDQRCSHPADLCYQEFSVLHTPEQH